MGFSVRLGSLESKDEHQQLKRPKQNKVPGQDLNKKSFWPIWNNPLRRLKTGIWLSEKQVLDFRQHVYNMDNNKAGYQIK